MLPKQLKRVRMFDSGALKTSDVKPGMFFIHGTYGVRDMSDYFEPTGLYIPRDWTSPESTGKASGSDGSAAG